MYFRFRFLTNSNHQFIQEKWLQLFVYREEQQKYLVIFKRSSKMLLHFTYSTKQKYEYATSFPIESYDKQVMQNWVFR